jgi:hypothetical protein
LTVGAGRVVVSVVVCRRRVVCLCRSGWCRRVLSWCVVSFWSSCATYQTEVRFELAPQASRAASFDNRSFTRTVSNSAAAMEVGVMRHAGVTRSDAGRPRSSGRVAVGRQECAATANRPRTDCVRLQPPAACPSAVAPLSGERAGAPHVNRRAAQPSDRCAVEWSTIGWLAVSHSAAGHV